jgi:hypothetical protein
MDLNHRPLPYQGSALTKLSYRPLFTRMAKANVTGLATPVTNQPHSWVSGLTRYGNWVPVLAHAEASFKGNSRTCAVPKGSPET